MNLICGANGQGKTSLLEAIYLVATSRSFRTHRARELVSHGSEAGSVRAQLRDGAGVREQLVAISGAQRVIRVGGDRPATVAEFAVRTPVTVFHPGELTLTMGPASSRRTLLDRVALFVERSSHDLRMSYDRAMKARQRLLQQGSSVSGLEAYEKLMAVHGAAVTRARRNAAAELLAEAASAFIALAPQTLRLNGRYVPGGSEDAAQALAALESNRQRDRRRGGAGFGPHRDELELELDGRAARVVASQGQHRLLTLSLKIAEMTCIARASGTRPLLLLDDVSSELDAERTEAFFGLLGAIPDQVFITTTRRELLSGLERRAVETRVFEVSGGQVHSVAA